MEKKMFNFLPNVPQSNFKPFLQLFFPLHIQKKRKERKAQAFLLNSRKLPPQFVQSLIKSRIAMSSHLPMP
jgi:hypothetical protein